MSPSSTINELVRQYLHPIATSEDAMSRTLAIILNNRNALNKFLNIISSDEYTKRLDEENRMLVKETVERLLRYEDIEIIVEAQLANTGNIDISIVSQEGNAIVIIENKIKGHLGLNQLTKYRRAIIDSDPYWDGLNNRKRVFSTVLLRPSYIDDSVNRKNDPDGFNNSIIISYGVVNDLINCLPERKLDLVLLFGVVAHQQVNKLSVVKDKISNIDCRSKQIETIKEEIESIGGVMKWKIKETTNCGIHICTPDNEIWKVTIGNKLTDNINVYIGNKLLNKKRINIPTKLIHLSYGYDSIRVPSPFPASDRPWSSENVDAWKAQARVVRKILFDIFEDLK